MIVRTWRGATRAENTDTYLDYLRKTGFAGFRATPGNRGAIGLRRVRDGKAEFFLLSFWDSEDAIRRFAGEDIEQAVFYPEDEEFLTEKDEQVEHFELVFLDEPREA